MDFRSALIILRDEAVQDFGEKAALFRVEPPHDAEVYSNKASVPRIGEQVALVHVRVKKSVANRVFEEGADDVEAESPAIQP